MISADGRFVAFASDASDLVANDTNGANDVFVRDLQLGTTTLVSINRFGTGSGNDLRFDSGVTLISRATAGSWRSAAQRAIWWRTIPTVPSDVFVRDLQLGTTRW